MVVAPPQPRSPSRDTGTEADVLRVANLGVRLDKVTILEDVSFHVRRGTTLAIVGPNGAGKTTLFRVLLGIVPHTWTVNWSCTFRIGLVPQYFFLITLDIHIVSQYSDAVLALNRTVRFFGASSRFSEPDLLKEIFGSGAGLAEHKHDFGTREFR